MNRREVLKLFGKTGIMVIAANLPVKVSAVTVRRESKWSDRLRVRTDPPRRGWDENRWNRWHESLWRRLSF